MMKDVNSQIEIPKFDSEDKDYKKILLHVNPFWEITLVSTILVITNVMHDFQFNKVNRNQNVTLTTPFSSSVVNKSNFDISIFDEKGNDLIKEAEDITMKAAYEQVKENLSFMNKAKNAILILGIALGLFIISLPLYTNISFNLSIPASLMGFSTILYKVLLKDD